MSGEGLKPISQRELGINKEGQTNQTRLFPPRDRRGRIRWKLPGRTEEENLQIGISNVQWLFLNAFPDFEQQFLRDRAGIIVSEKREAARDFILHRFTSTRDFVKYIGASPLQSYTVPYFEGSFAVVIKKSFSPWGIKFEDKKPRLIWSKKGNTTDENRQIGIQYLQKIMLSKIPEISESLVQIDGQIVVSPSRRDQIKILLLERCGDRALFESMFGLSPLEKEVTPYFNGSYVTALKASLEPWGIQILLKDFRLRRGLWAGKTEEECIGIMQSLWLETYPEFTQLFPCQKDGLIEAEKIEDARKYILERISCRTDFIAVFSGTPTNSHTVPFFEGSFISAVRKTFGNWGISFKTKDFAQYRNLWYGKDKDKILETARIIFLEEYPEFGKMFLDKDSAKVVSEKVQEAKLFILQYIGSSERFIKLFSSRCLRGTPYFNIIEEAFAPAGIHFKPGEIRQFILSLRKAKTDAPEGWMTNNGIASMKGFTNQRIKNIAERYRTTYPEWFRTYCIHSGKRPYGHYAPELVEEILKVLRDEGVSTEDKAAVLFQEYTHLLLSGQIMSLEEFVKMKEREHD